jgi:hypothetical protein
MASRTRLTRRHQRRCGRGHLPQAKYFCNHTETNRSDARILAGGWLTMLENLFGTAVVLFIGYMVIEGIARWMLDRRHSRGRAKHHRK